MMHTFSWHLSGGCCTLDYYEESRTPHFVYPPLRVCLVCICTKSPIKQQNLPAIKAHENCAQMHTYKANAAKTQGK